MWTTLWYRNSKLALLHSQTLADKFYLLLWQTLVTETPLSFRRALQPNKRAGSSAREAHQTNQQTKGQQPIVPQSHHGHRAMAMDSSVLKLTFRQLLGVTLSVTSGKRMTLTSLLVKWQRLVKLIAATFFCWNFTLFAAVWCIVIKTVTVTSKNLIVALALVFHSICLDYFPYHCISSLFVHKWKLNTIERLRLYCVPLSSSLVQSLGDNRLFFFLFWLRCSSCQLIPECSKMGSLKYCTGCIMPWHVDCMHRMVQPWWSVKNGPLSDAQAFRTGTDFTLKLTIMCELLQATEHPGGKGPATELANISAGASCIQPTTNNVTFCSQPDVRVFGNTQNKSQVNNDSSKQNVGPGNMTVESTAICTVGGISAGTGAVNSINSDKVGTSGPKTGSGIESTSRNVSSWKGFSGPNEALLPLSASVKSRAAHSVCSENITPLGAHGISSNATHSGVHSVNLNRPQSGFHSVNQNMPLSDFHIVNQNMPQSGFHSVNQNMPQSGIHSVRAMGRTPVVKMGSGAVTPGVSGKVNTPKVKLSLMEGSMDKPAANEQTPVTELGGKRQADDTGNVSNHSGSGWEHLNLYHSNRESMVYQGEDEDGSVGEGVTHLRLLNSPALCTDKCYLFTLPEYTLNSETILLWISWERKLFRDWYEAEWWSSWASCFERFIQYSTFLFLVVGINSIYMWQHWTVQNNPSQQTKMIYVSHYTLWQLCPTHCSSVLQVMQKNCLKQEKTACHFHRYQILTFTSTLPQSDL